MVLTCQYTKQLLIPKEKVTAAQQEMLTDSQAFGHHVQYAVHVTRTHSSALQMKN